MQDEPRQKALCMNFRRRSEEETIRLSYILMVTVSGDARDRELASHGISKQGLLNPHKTSELRQN